MKELSAKIGEMEYDGLITATIPQVCVGGGVIDKLAVEKTLKRGTVLSKGNVSGKLFVLGETQTYETYEDFEGDGTENDFVLTVATKPTALNAVVVAGEVVAATAYSYTAATGTITFTTAPNDGDEVKAYYNVNDTGNADSILCDDTVVGTNADVTAVVYLAGCFDPNKVVIADGYTMTEADKDKLRERGIIFKAASEAE